MADLISLFKGEVQKVRSLMPASFRYGAPYRRQLKFLTESQYFSREELDEYQVQQLRRLLKHCFVHVPYYREMAARLGCSAEDFRSVTDLAKLPILTRDLVRERQVELYADNVPASRRQRRFTGGTAGQPLGFVVEGGRTDPLERAFVARIWNWFGARFEDPAAIVRGYAVDPARLRQGLFWQRWYPERNWACFSSYHMSEANLPAYAEQIRKLDPVFISCVASDLDPLARYWVKQGLPRLPRLRFVHQSGMLMYPEQRERFEQAFGVRAFSTYGQSECSVFASECEHSTDYHLFSEYGVTELLRQGGDPAGPEELGEIVATGFNNYAMPLVRYRTGDLAARSPRGCECGRHFRMLSRLEGRGQYMVVLSDGLVVGLNSILYGSHMPELKAIKQVQVHQEKPGEMFLLVVPTADFDSEAGGRLARGLEKACDDKMRVEVRLVDEIPRADGGKFKILIQKLPVTWWTGFEAEAPPGAGQDSPGSPS